MLRLCEIGEDKVKEVSQTDGGYIDWFCLDVINKIWLNRNRVKSYECGATNPLFEFTNSTEPSTFINIDTDFNFDYHYQEAKEIIQKDINSSDIDLNYKARVFSYSMQLKIEDGELKEGGKWKNALQFSKGIGINYTSIYAAFVAYKKRLKEKLT